MSGKPRSVRVSPGRASRPRPPVSAPPPRYALDVTEDGRAQIVELGCGELVLELGDYAPELETFAELLKALRPDERQLRILLGEGHGRRFLIRLRLKRGGTCCACGRWIPAGEVAYWHRLSRLIRHVDRPCPRPADALARKRKTAA